MELLNVKPSTFAQDGVANVEYLVIRIADAP